MSAPSLSVVMHTWNGEAFVAETIESILAQTYSDFEFIVIDDCSNDSTPGIVREFADRDRRIHPVFLPDRRSRSACANLGVSMARAAVVARIDHDDVALPERFERQLAWMRERDLDVCGTHAMEFGLRTGLISFPESHEGIEYEQIFRIGVLNPTIVIRTDVLRRWPYRDTPFEDYELWTRLLPNCRMGNLPVPLTRHRAHDRQAHIVEGRACAIDMAKYRFGHFYRLFPGTPLRDYLPVARMADRRPMTSVDELERAGQWLVRLAQPPDHWLRFSMVQRWLRTCALSRDLGPEVEAIRKDVEALLNPGPAARAYESSA